MTILLTDDQAAKVREALQVRFQNCYLDDAQKPDEALIILDGAQRVEVVDANTDLEPQQELYAVKETK
jgi:hypothetical protein